MDAELSIDINAPASRAIEVYLDYGNWHKLFPLTIQAVKFISKENNVLTVEVNHKTEGFVINIITVLSDHEIKLEEFKPKYNAIFINRFEAVNEGTLYTVIAHVSLKGIYKIASPFIKALVKNRIRKFVLEPMKSYAENNNTFYKIKKTQR
jgi:hypothetical protein